MASTIDYVKCIASQLQEAGVVITYKKLFGECGLWCQGKFFGPVETNQFYVKITKAGYELLPNAEPAAPHGGEPGMYLVEELEDRDFLGELARKTCLELPEPKNRKTGKKDSKEKKIRKILVQPLLTYFHNYLFCTIIKEA